MDERPDLGRSWAIWTQAESGGGCGGGGQFETVPKLLPRTQTSRWDTQNEIGMFISSTL